MPVMGPTGLRNDIRGLALGSIRGELFPLVGSLIANAQRLFVYQMLKQQRC